MEVVIPESRMVNLENQIIIRYWVVRVRYYRNGVWGPWLLVVMGRTFKEKCKHENHDLLHWNSHFKCIKSELLSFSHFVLVTAL